MPVVLQTDESESTALVGVLMRGYVVLHSRQLLLHQHTPSSCALLPPFREGPPYKFRDGGLVANNPARRALDEALSLWPHHPIELLLSIGTGQSTDKAVNPGESICLSNALSQASLRVVLFAFPSEPALPSFRALPGPGSFAQDAGLRSRLQARLPT